MILIAEVRVLHMEEGKRLEWAASLMRKTED